MSLTLRCGGFKDGALTDANLKGAGTFVIYRDRQYAEFILNHLYISRGMHYCEEACSIPALVVTSQLA
jgi:hypothetical protein